MIFFPFSTCVKDREDNADEADEVTVPCGGTGGLYSLLDGLLLWGGTGGGLLEDDILWVKVEFGFWRICLEWRGARWEGLWLGINMMSSGLESFAFVIFELAFFEWEETGLSLFREVKLESDFGVKDDFSFLFAAWFSSWTGFEVIRILISEPG